MKIILLKIIHEYCKKQNSAKQSLLAWYYEAYAASWKTPQDIKNRYPSASFLEGNGVIFNIEGNQYRMVTEVAYNSGYIYIVWIGTYN